MKRAKLDNAAAVFITPDIRRTAVYYGETFGFTVVEHFDAEEPFAAIYRDSVEILLVQAKRGEFQPNTVRYGAGSTYTSTRTRSRAWIQCSRS